MASRLFQDRERLWRCRKPGFNDHLVRLQRRLENAPEQLIGGGRALAAGRLGDDVTAKREQLGGQLGRGVGVGEAAAYGSPVADDAVRDQAPRLAEQRAYARHEVRLLNSRLPRE